MRHVLEHRADSQLGISALLQTVMKANLTHALERREEDPDSIADSMWVQVGRLLFT
jgi:hypothetical protein